MKQFFKLTCIVLAMLIAATTIFSCSEGSDKQTISQNTASGEVTSETVEETTRILPDLPERNLDGYVFRVITKGDWNAHWSTRDIFAAEINGEPINDAVYNRNSKIGEQYNFTIKEIEEFSDYAGAAQKSIVANSDDYDMLSIGLSTMGTFSTNGYVVDLKMVPYMDLEKPWYDQNANASLSIANKLFATTGELIVMDNDATWVILFNKGLAEEIQLPDLYQAVKDGTWTIDMLYECVTKAPSDLDGNGKMDGADRWGIIGESFNTYALCAGAGGRVISKDQDDLPYVSINTPEFIQIFEKAIRINDRSSDHCLYVSNYSGYTDVWGEFMDKMFSDGKVLFNFAGMNRVTLFRGMDADFGILPVPKGTEAQKRYYCPVSCWSASSIMIPNTVVDLERTGIIIEALSAESMYLLTPAYYEITLKTKYARDNESQDMLDIIFLSTVFDLGNIFDWGGVFSLPLNLTESNNTDFASSYARLEKSVVSTMNKTIDKFLSQNQ